MENSIEYIIRRNKRHSEYSEFEWNQFLKSKTQTAEIAKPPTQLPKEENLSATGQASQSSQSNSGRWKKEKIVSSRNHSALNY